jgi:formylglycine-generating enzyme required for sulfatase activity
MAGNVQECCLDWTQQNIAWNTDGIPNAMGATLADGVTPGERRVMRGGSYYSNWNDVRHAYRYSSVPAEQYEDGMGYRVVSTFGLE